MKPFGLHYTSQGCLCALCRSRGYRKGNEYGTSRRISRHRARQEAKREIRMVLRETD